MSDGRKVLQVAAYTAPFSGSFIASLRALERELAARGSCTAYVFPHAAANKAWCRLLCSESEVYFAPLGQFSPRTILSLSKTIRKSGAGIIHTHFDLYDIPAAISAPFSARLIWHFHDAIQPATEMKRLLKQRLHYGLFGRRARLIAAAEHYRMNAVQMGFSAARSVTIVNGIDTARFADCRRNSRGGSPLLLIYAGHPDRKGLDIAIEACRLLAAGGHSFRLGVIGPVGTYLDSLIDTWPRWLELLPLSEDITTYYAKCHIFLSPSRAETFAYTVAEATAAGVPVVSSDIPGLEWAHELPSVSFFASEDPSALAEKIIKVLTIEDESLAAQVKEARRIVEEKYSIHQWARHIADFYQQSLGSSAENRRKAR